MFQDPGSVAVVGASADPAKWGYWLAKGALAGSDRRRVHLINHRTPTIFSGVCHPSLSALDEAPELVALCVPGSAVAGVVEEALALGTRGFLAVNAAVPDQNALAERIRAAGARLIGPNSLGLFDAQTRLSLAWGEFTPGPLAIVSQSGQVGTEIATLAARLGVGVSRFVSVGNQADVTALDVLADLAGHADTRCVALYLESFDERLLGILRTLRASAKPVLLLTIGASIAGRRAAVSHTGSMTSPMEAVDALCRAAGASRLDSPSQLAELAALLCARPLRPLPVARTGVAVPSRLAAHPLLLTPIASRAVAVPSQLAAHPLRPARTARRAVAVVGDSGGQGAIAADLLRGWELPTLSAGLQAALAARLPATASVANPVDLAGGGERDLNVYADLPALLLASGEVDAVLLTGYFGQYCVDAPELTEHEVAVAAQLAKVAGAVASPMTVSESAATCLPTERCEMAAGVDPLAASDGPVAEAHRAAACGGVLVVHSMAEGGPAIAALRAGGVAVYANVDAAARALTGWAELAGRDLEEVAGSEPRTPFKISSLMVPGEIVRGEAEIAAAAGKLRAPYALKADWLAHKTEHGGVRVGLSGVDAVRTAYREMKERLGDGPFLMQEMDLRAGVVEMLIGARRVPGVGPVVVVGAGGTEAELLCDIVMELAPVSVEIGRSMVDRLRCAPLLHGWRGGPGVDIEALVEAVVGVSWAICADEGLAELEFNPVRVGADGLCAVDMLAVRV